MTALDFPSTPTNGQIYNGFVWDDTAGVWKKQNSIKFYVGDTAPNSPSPGDGWFNSTTGTTLVYYGDVDSEQWVELGEIGPTGPTGPQGATGAASTVTGPTGPSGGFESSQIVENKSSNYSIVSGDAGKLIINSAAITVTIDNVLSIGQQVDFLQNNVGQITFAAGSGVTLNSKNGNLKTATQYSPASVKCISSGVFVLAGDLGA